MQATRIATVTVMTPENDQLGLERIFTPDPPVSGLPFIVIFIHGFGGHPRRTWTSASTKFFWPEWLGSQDKFKTATILSFGYDAAFKNITTIQKLNDYARQLVNDVCAFYTSDGEVFNYNSKY